MGANNLMPAASFLFGDLSERPFPRRYQRLPTARYRQTNQREDTNEKTPMGNNAHPAQLGSRQHSSRGRKAEIPAWGSDPCVIEISWQCSYIFMTHKLGKCNVRTYNLPYCRSPITDICTSSSSLSLFRSRLGGRTTEDCPTSRSVTVPSSRPSRQCSIFDAAMFDTSAAYGAQIAAAFLAN